MNHSNNTVQVTALKQLRVHLITPYDEVNVCPLIIIILFPLHFFLSPLL